MRVSEKLQVLDFSADFPDHVKASNLLPVEYLHSNFMSSQFMFAHCRRNNFNTLAPGLIGNIGNILWSYYNGKLSNQRKYSSMLAFCLPLITPLKV